MIDNLAELRRWDIPNIATFVVGAGGLPCLQIRTSLAQADIYTHGAHLTHWQTGEDPIIFLSKQSLFAPGKAIRGGVPVCFPWFGVRPGAPAHGFARTMDWAVESITLHEGAVVAVFRLESDDTTLALWPHDFVARMRYKVGATLEMSLIVENPSAESFTFTEALHTYFAVGNIKEASVAGLDGVAYRDTVGEVTMRAQAGSIRFAGETDSIYMNTQAACVLEDPILARAITIQKTGSDGTVVWNPWTAKSAAMADFGNDEWPRMVCIETVNSADNAVTVAPGASHTMTALITTTRF